MKKILKVLAQGEPFAVQSQKAEGGQLMKCKLVYAVLRFQVREYNGQMFQDILATDLVKMNN